MSDRTARAIALAQEARQRERIGDQKGAALCRALAEQLLTAELRKDTTR